MVACSILIRHLRSSRGGADFIAASFPARGSVLHPNNKGIHTVQKRYLAEMASSSSIKITAKSKCQGCEGLTEAMKLDEVELQRAMLIPLWATSEDGLRLTRSLKLKNFASGLQFVNRIGELAEAEGHHPDLTIRSYNHVDIALSTHSVGGITENDLIMAVKIDTIPVPSVRRL